MYYTLNETGISTGWQHPHMFEQVRRTSTGQCTCSEPHMWWTMGVQIACNSGKCHQLTGIIHKCAETMGSGINTAGNDLRPLDNLCANAVHIVHNDRHHNDQGDVYHSGQHLSKSICPFISVEQVAHIGISGESRVTIGCNFQAAHSNNFCPSGHNEGIFQAHPSTVHGVMT